jgi:hypothetical protein
LKCHLPLTVAVLVAGRRETHLAPRFVLHTLRSDFRAATNFPEFFFVFAKAWFAPAVVGYSQFDVAA